MNLEELLKKLGYTDDQIKTIVEGMKENKLYISNEENIDTRYSKLKEQHDVKDKELTTANELIKSLQNSAKGNEDLQTKITDYETKIAQLQEENKQEKIKNQLTIALKDAGVTDIDYIAFKIKEKMKSENKNFELDDNEKIKGLSEMIESEKKSSPNFFKSESKKAVLVKELGNPKEDNNDNEPKSFKEAVKQKYEEKNNTDI